MPELIGDEKNWAIEIHSRVRIHLVRPRARECIPIRRRSLINNYIYSILSAKLF